MRLFPKMHFAQ